MTVDSDATIAAASSIGGGAEIAPETSIGAVTLTVPDGSRARRFYEQVLGLVGSVRDDGITALAADDGQELVILHEDRDAPPFDPTGNGLFHLALLVPDRRELARSLRRIALARWPLTGASDHLVSEALYLRDPDGNGIEVYCDRPRSQWPNEHGAIRMATVALDLDDVLGELDGVADESTSAAARHAGAACDSAPIAAGTRVGHVHLQVGQLDRADRFYCGVLGFEAATRGYPGALFASAGGYHHHIGLNTWQSRGAPPLAPGGAGIRSFEVVLPDAAALDRVLDRVRSAKLVTDPADGAMSLPTAALVHDPFGIAVVLRCA